MCCMRRFHQNSRCLHSSPSLKGVLAKLFCRPISLVSVACFEPVPPPTVFLDSAISIVLCIFIAIRRPSETSVTLEGIRYIVDTGKHKTREYNSTTGMESLQVQDISKAQVSSGLCGAPLPFS